MRILLIRHGQPHIALRPRTSHGGFADYIDAYEEAGLSPSDLPPQEARDLVKELDHVFTSGACGPEASFRNMRSSLRMKRSRLANS